jgi:hypothetical protein
VKVTPSNALLLVSAGLLLLIIGFVAGSVGWRTSLAVQAPAGQSPSEPPPRKVGDPDRVRQVLRAGKTYQTRTTGAIHVRGQDNAAMLGLGTGLALIWRYRAPSG